MESIQSKLAKKILQIFKINKMWKLTGNELRDSIEKRQLSESHEPPRIIQNRFNIIKNEINGYCYYVMKPLRNTGQKHILFLHGGAYVYEINSMHWRFLRKLSDDKSFICE